jgi:hypothetical protein
MEPHPEDAENEAKKLAGEPGDAEVRDEPDGPGPLPGDEVDEPA